MPQTSNGQVHSYQLSKKTDVVIRKLFGYEASTVTSAILDSLSNINYTERLKSLERALADVSNNDSLELDLNEKLGRESKGLDRNNDAYKYFSRMLYLAEKLNDQRAIARACYEIGNNVRLGTISKSPYDEYFKRSMDIFDLLGDPVSKSYSKYMQLLLVQDDQERLSLAKEAIALLADYQNRSDPLMMEILARHYNVAGLYADTLSSLDYFLKGLMVAKESGNYLMQAYILNNIGFGFNERGQFNEAIPYHLEALDVSLSVGLKGLASNSLNNLSGCYRSMGRYKEALEFFNCYVFFSASVLNDQYYEDLAREKVTHEVDRVELQNDLLLAEQKLQARQRWILIITSILLLVIAGFIFWSGRKVKIANQKLKSLDKVKSRFFANISHELRTPITLINGPIEAILNKENGKINSAISDQLTVVQNNGKNLLNLVNEILDLTKLEAGKLHLVENPVQFYSFLIELLEAYQAEIANRKIDFQFVYNFDKKASIAIDEAKFAKILNNLLSNAFKFSDDGGCICLKVEKVSANLIVRVRDFGLGIHPDDISHVFDRFYQSGQVNDTARGGTGIGLALSQELAKLHGGKIHVESEFGKGSEFIFSFPLKAVTSNGEEYEQVEFNVNTIQTSLDAVISKYAIAFAIHKPVLLLTEDHDEMREFISSIVKPFFDVMEARNGLEALELLEKNHVDMIVSDVMMPKMDGFELLEKIKGNEHLKRISMIMLTARAAEEDKLFALTLGVDDYLTKPFSREELLVRTRNILDNRISRKVAENEIDSEEDNIPDASSQFVVTMREIIEKHLSDDLLSVSFLASEMAMSERQLLRRMKTQTGLTPVQFIREVRLQKAKQLLENHQIDSVSQAAYKVGFDKVQYFSTQYMKRFGKKPSDSL